MDLIETENEAINFLRANTPKGEELFVGISGGKDSIVTAALMAKSNLNYRLFHNFSGIEPPPVVHFIKKFYPDCTILRPRFNYWHNVIVKNPPLINSRWCCEKLRKQPSYVMPHKYRVFGIRAEESSKRSNYGRINKFAASKYGRPEHTQLYPIFHWTEAAVWEYIEHYDLPYPSLYDEGIDRIGCVVCPYHTVKQHEFYRARFPQFFNMFEKTVRKWYNRRKESGRDMHHASAEEFLDAWYHNKASWYQKDGRRNRDGSVRS